MKRVAHGESGKKGEAAPKGGLTVTFRLSIEHYRLG